jgi:hypothetical protein
MGASWRPGSAALLLLLATAWAPAAQAGSAEAPELTDPAGDQAGAAGPIVVGGVNDDAFDDVDLVAAWLEERTLDCVGAANGTCPTVTLVVQTSAGWGTGSMVVSFAIARGPTSLPGSTASGQAFTLYVNGTTVEGLANATAANAPDGLHLTLPLPQLGAVGGDVLTGLTLSTSRFDDGTLQGVALDDQTGTDDAGPGLDYVFQRPPVAPRLLLEVLSVDGRAGSASTVSTRDPVDVVLRITNLGLDDDGWQLSLASRPPLADPPVFLQAFTGIAAGTTAQTTVPISLADMAEGRIVLTFTVSSERGASATARATLTLDLPSAPPPPPSEREVKPAGLTFLTGTAETLGFDGPFGSYAELALLALLVLLVLLALFLLLALGRPLPREAAAETPGPARRPTTAGPAGFAQTVRAAPAAEPEEGPDVDPALFAALEPGTDEAAPEPVPPAPMPTTSGAAIRIDEVRHEPREPAPGERVTTEVVLRNDGPSATLRVELSVDGQPAAERTVAVPSRATKAVTLPWTAGPGDNRVRVRVLPG